MKTKLLISLLLSFYFFHVSSQVPQGFNYQAIARDASGNPLINQSLPVRITIQSDSLGGTTFWIEEQSSVMTNNFGLFTLILGKGVKKTGSTAATFNDIDWRVTPIFIKTEINYNGWKNMGSSRLWSVPYSMVAGELSGSVKKLAVTGETSNMEEPLFEVKNKNGQTVFAVYNEGVRIYVSDGVAKGATKGGFAIGGFGTVKGDQQNYFVVNSDSIRAYIDTNPAKSSKGGFAIGGFNPLKGVPEEYLRVSRDSTRVYVNDGSAKGVTKGGFAIGGFGTVKAPNSEYLRVTSDSVKVSKSLLIPRLTTYERDHLSFVPGEALIIFNMTEGCMQIFKNNVWSNIWCFNCAPAFIIQPVDKSICSGENAVFFVSATGTSLSYQWQQSPDNGTSWNDISNGGTIPAFSGAKGYTLTLTNVPVGFNSYKYRCVVAGSCLPNVVSNAVTLNVGSTPPVISTQPTDQQLSTGCSASFSVSAPGSGLSYKWQQSSDAGSTWNNISDGGTSPVFAGAITSVLSLSNVPFAYINYKFRCILSNLCGADITSSAATLTVNTSPGISAQPLNQTVYSGSNISFSITATGSGNNYHWQESTDGGSSWSYISNGGTNPVYSGTFTSILTLTNIPASYSSYKYRCVVSHYCRPDATSDAATLTVATATPVSDVDGNSYTTVGIGSQLWMAENLRTTKYKDNSPITLVTTQFDWSIASAGAYCWYNNDEAANKLTYGALYNWYTVNSGNLCPEGWHVPTDAEWTTLTNYLGGTSVAGGKLKESGITHWQTPNTGATNESGFTALPGGTRSNVGSDMLIGQEGYWWSSTESTPPPNSGIAYFRKLSNNAAFIPPQYTTDKKAGLSVRCIKN